MKLGAFFVEILPLLAFFVGYQYFGLIAAAALSVDWRGSDGSGLAVSAGWPFPLSLAMSAAFGGGMGVEDGIFIKIQPTIFVGCLTGASWRPDDRSRDDAAVFRRSVLADCRYMAAAQLSLGVFLPASGGCQ